jgi:hypothetical protein
MEGGVDNANLACSLVERLRKAENDLSYLLGRNVQRPRKPAPLFMEILLQYFRRSKNA